MLFRSHIKTGKVRPVAVSSARRAAVLPEVPSITDTYPELDATGWTGLFAPAATSREIIAKINADANAVLGRADIRERFTEQGAEVVGGTPEQLTAYIASERKTWTPIIQKLNLKLD